MRRPAHRSTLWLAGVPALALACGAVVAGAAPPVAPPAVPQPAAALQAYVDFVHALAVRDAERALAAFAPDARVTAGPGCSTAAPCIGHAAIRERYLLPALRRRDALPMGDQRFDGVWLRTHGDAVALADGRHSRGGHVFELRGGRIASLSQTLDAVPDAVPRVVPGAVRPRSTAAPGAAPLRHAALPPSLPRSPLRHPKEPQP